MLFNRLIAFLLIPMLLVYPARQKVFDEWMPPTTYDGIIEMLSDIETGAFERKYPHALDRVNAYLLALAQEGALPDETITFPQKIDYTLCSASIGKKISKGWKETKKFVKKHKKEIIIGTVVVVVTVVVVTSAGTAAGAAGGALAAGAGSFDSGSEPISIPTRARATSPEVQEKIAAIKGALQDEDLLKSESMPIEETGRLLGPIFAYDALKETSEEWSIQKTVEQAFGIWRDPSPTKDPLALSYQAKGERALSTGHYQEAIEDFSKAITISPEEPAPYLQRSATYFELGNYDKSSQDFQLFTDQAEKIPFSKTDFTIGFAKGIPQGAYDSGKGIVFFLGDLITEPIHTAQQMYTALETLAGLASQGEWATIGEALSPELHELITNWDNITSTRKGELAGYALGKHGTDLAAPGVLAKAASKTTKSARELTTALKNLQAAEGTLVLETTASTGAQARKAINAGRKTGFKPDTIVHKQATQPSAPKTYDHLKLSRTESLKLHKAATKQLKPYKNKPMPEYQVREMIHETGLPTFPRPKGIPEDYVVVISGKAGGMKYVHPKDPGTYVRVMPGKAHSRWSSQRRPYVVQQKNGKILDKFGNTVDNCGKKISDQSADAHIPLEEFSYLGGALVNR